MTRSGRAFPAAEWDEHVIEEHVPHSTALHAHLAGGGRYLTGPLARYSLGSQWLSPLAREAARAAGLGETCDNPFRSIIVRAVETVYAVEEALRLIAAYTPPDPPAEQVRPGPASATVSPRLPGGPCATGTRSTRPASSPMPASSRRRPRTRRPSRPTCARSPKPGSTSMTPS